jgi:phosphatidylserine decarboxylase
VYARNERVIGYFHRDDDKAPLCAVVAVGGIAVGKIVLEVTQLRAHPSEHRSVVLEEPWRAPSGEEWGHFAGGSTIVVLLAPGAGALRVDFGARVRAGEVIGALAAPREEKLSTTAPAAVRP